MDTNLDDTMNSNLENIKDIKKEWLKAECMMIKAEGAISALSQYVVDHFEQDVIVAPSTDGAMITDDNGEIMPFSVFFGFNNE